MAVQSESLKSLLTEDLPFPYVRENFTKKEIKILLQYFSNYDKPVFAIHNLPQEVIGAMFSRYSRSSKSVRRLFLDEFWNSELDLKKISNVSSSLEQARDRTRDFYKKVFAEYGDDSVIQMGSVHVAFENVSQILGAKAIEDTRVGASYIEKSTRYVDFGTKVNNHYLYLEPKEIMSTSLASEFTRLQNDLFEAYNRFLPVMIEYLGNSYPIEGQKFEDQITKKPIVYSAIKNNEDKQRLQTAYKRALRAKAFDTIRFFLPVTTVTNLGAHFTGQAAEMTINKMLISPYHEVRQTGAYAFNELQKISPNFLQNIDHPFGEIARKYRKDVRRLSETAITKSINKISRERYEDTLLVDWDTDADIRIASQILYTYQKKNLAKVNILEWARGLKKQELKEQGGDWSPTLTKIIKSSVPDRSLDGINRRQKLPRAFEQAFAEVEFYDNIGTYKDLQRHRMCTTERQYLSAEEVYIPDEYRDKQLTEVYDTYLQLAERAWILQKKLVKTGREELTNAGEYVAILGNKIRFNIRANLRQWVFLGELRTIAGGHPTYRKATQEAVKQIVKAMPFMRKLFTHVDWVKDYGLGRLRAEVSTQRRLAEIKV